jgi:hypothetical protein
VIFAEKRGLVRKRIPPERTGSERDAPATPFGKEEKALCVCKNLIVPGGPYARITMRALL